MCTSRGEISFWCYGGYVEKTRASVRTMLPELKGGEACHELCEQHYVI